HPASAVSALFDEPIRGYAATPQGYCVDQFHRDGMLFLGASAPVNLGAHMFQVYGRRLADAMDAYDRVASFGAMIEDDSRGRVTRARDGSPRLTYFLERSDVDRVHRAMVRIARMYLA